MSEGRITNSWQRPACQ